jgi:hypothetical protein
MPKSITNPDGPFSIVALDVYSIQCILRFSVAIKSLGMFREFAVSVRRVDAIATHLAHVERWSMRLALHR